MEQVTFEDLPSPFFTRLLKSYLTLNDLVSLRSVSWKLREFVDCAVNFHVPVNNSSLRWFKEIVPDIQEVIVGPLSAPRDKPMQTQLMQTPPSSYPEVKVFTCLPEVNEAYFPKLQEIFPNITDLTLRKLRGNELARVLELSTGATIQHVDDLLIPLLWTNLQKLEITLSTLDESHVEIFDVLSRRTYPTLKTLHLEHRVLGRERTSYRLLHPIYISWLELIANHYKTLKNLTFQIDSGLPHIREGTSLEEQPKYSQLHSDLERVNSLQQMSFRPHEADSPDRGWNWAFTLLRQQKNLTHLSLDFSGCFDYWLTSDEHSSRNLTRLISNFSKTLKTFEYYVLASNSLTLDDITITYTLVTFDFGILKDCSKLEKVVLSRSWNRATQSLGPLLTFSNVQSLPSTLQVLNLYTECGELNLEDALWVAQNLIHLEEVKLPVPLEKSLVAKLLDNPSMKKFTLSRDAHTDKLCSNLIAFCESNPGLTHFSPCCTHAYDHHRRWIDLLFITVEMDKKRLVLPSSDHSLGESFLALFTA